MPKTYRVLTPLNNVLGEGPSYVTLTEGIAALWAETHPTDILFLEETPETSLATGDDKEVTMHGITKWSQLARFTINHLDAHNEVFIQDVSYSAGRVLQLIDPISFKQFCEEDASTLGINTDDLLGNWEDGPEDD